MNERRKVAEEAGKLIESLKSDPCDKKDIRQKTIQLEEMLGIRPKDDYALLARLDYVVSKASRLEKMGL